jgi:hypothetical protein
MRAGVLYVCGSLSEPITKLTIGLAHDAWDLGFSLCEHGSSTTAQRGSGLLYGSTGRSRMSDSLSTRHAEGFVDLLQNLDLTL